MPLPLSLACSECDRTQGLRDGSVTVEGTSLTCLGLPVEEVRKVTESGGGTYQWFPQTAERAFAVAAVDSSNARGPIAATTTAVRATFRSRRFRCRWRSRAHLG